MEETLIMILAITPGILITVAIYYIIYKIIRYTILPKIIKTIIKIADENKEP